MQLLPDLHSQLQITSKEIPSDHTGDLIIWQSSLGSLTCKQPTAADLLSAWFLGPFLKCSSGLSCINLVHFHDSLQTAKITQCMQKSYYHKWGWKYAWKKEVKFLAPRLFHSIYTSFTIKGAVGGGRGRGVTSKSNRYTFIHIQTQYIPRSNKYNLFKQTAIVPDCIIGYLKATLSSYMLTELCFL